MHRRPEAIAISTEHNRYTYQEIHQRSNQVANVLLQLGIQKQERVAIFLERSVESIIVMFCRDGDCFWSTMHLVT
ncbi:AMP-binding protein, partial [Escherichia sp. R-CC3]